MKINKRVFYILSSLLILCYSVLSPFYKVSALEKKDDLPAFNEVKNISVEFGKFKSDDLTYFWYNYFFIYYGIKNSIYCPKRFLYIK